MMKWKGHPMNLYIDKKTFLCFLSATVLFMGQFAFCFTQTIAEKKAGMMPSGGDLTKEMQKVLVQTNKELAEDHAQLRKLYEDVRILYQQNAPQEDFKDLLDQINTVRTEIENIEENWREMAASAGAEQTYSLWHQPETTLEQLVIDYGSHEYIYLIPPEIAEMRVSVDSNIPLPRASWNEMMEIILTQNGVGYKQLNPYLRQLFLLTQDKSNVKLITNNVDDLAYLSPDSRVCFVLSPEPSDVRRVWAFLNKFVNPNSTILQMVGRDILIVAPVNEIYDLLKLYDFVLTNKGDKDYLIKSVTKVDAEEMAAILAAIFDQFVEPVKTDEAPQQQQPQSGQRSKSLVDVPGKKGQQGQSRPQPQAQRDNQTNDINTLRVIPLKNIAQAVFLVGTKEEIRKAEEIIDQVENQVGVAREKIIFWYTTKHSDPEELAQVLEKIYTLMVETAEEEQQREMMQNEAEAIATSRTPLEPELIPPQVTTNYAAPPFVPYSPSLLYQTQYYQQGNYFVNPTPVEPRIQQPQIANRGRDNFIVDLKTGTIVMVVHADLLPQMKDLLKKLDVPKKMVQIETLVFEKRMSRQDNFGLNLLRIGDKALNQNIASVLWNNIVSPTTGNPNPINNLGIFDYILSREKEHGIPAFDLVYRFLIEQQDVSINASPSVVTVNQTPAVISIVEEISLNTGTFFVNTAGATIPESTFTRAQYGITISVTPNIHVVENPSYTGEDVSYVTLDTDITFDTIQPSTAANQPNVQRRHVTNQVRIPDGQTVVIGGLRRKNTNDQKDCIPYLGEIPGFGKLFSTTSTHEDTTELIIFITPKIITDPTEDFARLRFEEMCKRPGDIPEFLCGLNEALEWEENRLFAGTMNALFGLKPDRCVADEPCDYFEVEYDGR